MAVETNVLVYAHREEAPFHEAACGSCGPLTAISAATQR
jgi:hypothetical protein